MLGTQNEKKLTARSAFKCIRPPQAQARISRASVIAKMMLSTWEMQGRQSSCVSVDKMYLALKVA